MNEGESGRAAVCEQRFRLAEDRALECADRPAVGDHEHRLTGMCRRDSEHGRMDTVGKLVARFSIVTRQLARPPPREGFRKARMARAIGCAVLWI